MSARRQPAGLWSDRVFKHSYIKHGSLDSFNHTCSLAHSLAGPSCRLARWPLVTRAGSLADDVPYPCWPRRSFCVPYSPITLSSQINDLTFLSHTLYPNNPRPQRHLHKSATVNIAPRKPNWDLKRDLETKMALLNKRTRRAVRALIRTCYTPGAGTHHRGVRYGDLSRSLSHGAVLRLVCAHSGNGKSVSHARDTCVGASPSHRRVPSFRRHLFINIPPPSYNA